MATNYLTAHRRQITAMAAVFIASVAVGTPTASAEPDGGGTQVAYSNCVAHYRDGNPGATTAEVLFDCCIIVGGTWSSDDYRNGECTGLTWRGSTAPTAPPRVASLPGGWNQKQ